MNKKDKEKWQELEVAYTMAALDLCKFVHDMWGKDFVTDYLLDGKEYVFVTHNGEEEKEFFLDIEDVRYIAEKEIPFEDVEEWYDMNVQTPFKLWWSETRI